MDEAVFTPINEEGTMRLNFKSSEVEVVTGDIDQRKLGLRAVVRIGGKNYKVFGKACGLLGCHCDAYLKEVA